MNNPLTVWKFTEDMEDRVKFEIPRPAIILDVKIEPHPHSSYLRTITVWAIVDPNKEKEAMHLEVRGTGAPMGTATHHIKTEHDGPFVWHIFESELDALGYQA